MDTQDSYDPSESNESNEVSAQVAGTIMDNLEFTPRTIKEIEDRTKKPLMQAVGDISMTSLATIVMRGLRTDEKGAYGAISLYLKESNENDTMTLQILIIEKLESTGFLPRSLNLADKVRDGLEKAKNMDMSEEIVDYSSLGING